MFDYKEGDGVGMKEGIRKDERQEIGSCFREHIGPPVGGLRINPVQGLLNKIKDKEDSILIWFGGEHWDVLADMLDDLRRLYSDMCQRLSQDNAYRLWVAQEYREPSKYGREEECKSTKIGALVKEETT